MLTSTLMLHKDLTFCRVYYILLETNDNQPAISPPCLQEISTISSHQHLSTMQASAPQSSTMILH